MFSRDTHGSHPRIQGLVALTVLQGQSYVGMPKFGPTQLGCCTNGPWSDCRTSPMKEFLNLVLRRLGVALNKIFLRRTENRS